MAEPVYPFQSSELDRFEVPPWSTPMDDLSLVETVDCFGEGSRNCRRRFRRKAQFQLLRTARNTGWTRIGQIQPVVATPSIISELSNPSSASAGVRQPSVLRGLLLRAFATALSSSTPCWLRSVPFGKY